MARKPRSQNKATYSIPSGKGQARTLTHQEVLDEAMGKLTQGLTLPRPEEADYRLEDLLSVLLYAAAHRTTIEQAAQALEQAPHPNTVRGATASLRVEQLEAELPVLARERHARRYLAQEPAAAPPGGSY